jgi:hypothetical protein
VQKDVVLSFSSQCFDFCFSPLCIIMSSSRKYSLAVIAAVLLIAVYSLRASFSSETVQQAFSSPKHPSAKNVAVIIEDRPLAIISPLLLHFSSVLGPSWPIVYYTREVSNANSSAWQRAVEDGRIEIRQIPDGVQFTQHASVSEFLTSPWLWEQLAPAGHVLMFQTDSIVCSNSPARMDDFLQYDFIGAPIDVPKNPANGHGEGFNGGFSLRNRAMMLDIISKHSWKGEKESGEISQEGCVTTKPCLKFEDQWFYHKMKDMPEARLPTKEVAMKFAVETVWYDKPFAFHQVERWNKDKLGDVTEWCPEYAMATNDLLVKHS